MSPKMMFKMFEYIDARISHFAMVQVVGPLSEVAKTYEDEAKRLREELVDMIEPME